MTETPRKPHREVFDAFWRERTRISDPMVATHFKHDNTHHYDLALVERLVRDGSTVLDLGAGTCVVSGHLAPRMARVVAVDKFDTFLAAAAKHPRLVPVAADILDFATDERFDSILLFGVITYFDDDESAAIYRRCAGWLRPGGSLIVKHQCGVDGDVVVDRHSPQVGGRYVAFYRSLKGEQRLLREVFAQVETIDIYPPELNPWPDTHFYAFVCSQEVC